MSEEQKAETDGAAHCAIGPSTLPARAVCPCHDSAPGKADAQSGTRSHKVVEANIRNKQPMTPPVEDMFGVMETPEDCGVAPSSSYMEGTTEDEIARGEWGARTIMSLRNDTVSGAYIVTERRAVFNEHVESYAPDFRAALRGKFGTVDAWWESDGGDAIFIADYKTYANANDEKSYLPQGMMYAVLLDSVAAATSGKAHKTATFFVIAAGDHSVAKYTFSLDCARERTFEIIRRVEALKTGGIFATGEEARTKCGVPSAWCKTCAYAATCPAISRAVTMVSGGGILQKPLAVRMAIVPVLESFTKSVKAEVRAELDKGHRVFDEASGIEYALAERKGRGKLTDLRGLAESVIVYGVKPDDFAAAVSVSKTAVEGLLKAVDERENRKVKKADREAVYARYFSAPPVEKYVKRIS